MPAAPSSQLPQGELTIGEMKAALITSTPNDESHAVENYIKAGVRPAHEPACSLALIRTCFLPSVRVKFTAP